MVGASYAHLFIQVHITHELSTSELEHFTGLTMLDGALCGMTTTSSRSFLTSSRSKS